MHGFVRSPRRGDIVSTRDTRQATAHAFPCSRGVIWSGSNGRQQPVRRQIAITTRSVRKRSCANPALRAAAPQQRDDRRADDGPTGLAMPPKMTYRNAVSSAKIELVASMKRALLGVEPPATPAINAPSVNDNSLVLVQVDAHGFGGDVIFVDRHHGAPNLSADIRHTTSRSHAGHPTPATAP